MNGARRRTPIAAALAWLLAFGAAAHAQSIRDANVAAGRIRSDLPAGVGVGDHWLEIAYGQAGAEGCLWDSAASFSACPGRAGWPDRPDGTPVWAGVQQRSVACGGSPTRVGDSWIGCLAYDQNPYVALGNPGDAYWVLVANDEPSFDQCNEGPPGSSHRVAGASAQPRTMFKLDVLSNATAPGRRLRFAIDLGDKDFFCARTNRYEYSIPFLSIGAQDARGNDGPVGYVNRRGSPRGTIVFDARISSHATIACRTGTESICSPSSLGVHAGVYAYATWAGVPRLVFVDLHGSGVLDYSSGPPGESKWNWPVRDSFQYPGAEVLFFVAGSSMATYCGIDVARLPLTGTRVRYAIDFGKVLACADARGLAGDPMPAGDIALDGVHWYIEGSGTQGSLGLEVSAVETALFVDGFD